MTYKDVVVPNEYYQPPEFSECECKMCLGTDIICSQCGAPDGEAHCDIRLDWEWIPCNDCIHYNEDALRDPDRKRDERIDKELEEQGADCHD